MRSFTNGESALHKSLRGSDPDAALYWLGRMLEAGEDPLYVARLVGAIKAFLSRWNEGAKPFVWTKTAEQILAKAVR